MTKSSYLFGHGRYVTWVPSLDVLRMWGLFPWSEEKLNTHLLESLGKELSVLLHPSLPCPPGVVCGQDRDETEKSLGVLQPWHCSCVSFPLCSIPLELVRREGLLWKQTLEAEARYHEDKKKARLGSGKQLLSLISAPLLAGLMVHSVSHSNQQGGRFRGIHPQSSRH